MSHKLDFETDDINFNIQSKHIIFTENHLSFSFLDERTINCFEIIDLKFNDDLKQEIINYFSKSFLEEYQNEIYKKFNKHIFGDELLINIIFDFLKSSNLSNKKEIKKKFKTICEQLNDIKMK